MRSRLLAGLAVLAVLVAACGVVPSSAAAVVGGEKVPMDELSRLATARLEGLGLEGRDLRIAEQARELGLLTDTTVREGVSQAINQQQVAQDALPSLPEEVVDSLYSAEQQALGDGYDDALDELRVDEDEWRELYGRAAEVIVAGILFFGQQQQQPDQIPLAQSDYVGIVQRTTLSELVSVELTRQQFRALGLELSDGDLETQEQAIVSSFEDEEAFQAALDRFGYPTKRDFDELVVAHAVRSNALQQPDNADDVASLDPIEVEIPDRFGTWDAAQQRVVEPEA